ncbi:MAG TPA: hydrogenase maturation protease [Blastocatellia bacterium]|nr:hydrogenase maturation protease [Blastocatellia bacterium]
MDRPCILIAGIGNIFLGDDAFGSEVARRLCQRGLPDEVRVTDFGIRGFDLAYALLDDYDATILVDATPRGGEPGALYLIEPELSEFNEPDAGALMVEPHGMNPLKVLGLAKAMGGSFRRILLIGCEPASFGGEDGAMGLSEPVAAAVDEAIRMIESLVTEILNEHRCAAVL